MVEIPGSKCRDTEANSSNYLIPSKREWQKIRESCSQSDVEQAFELLQRSKAGAREYNYVIYACLAARQLDFLEDVALEGVRQARTRRQGSRNDQNSLEDDTGCRTERSLPMGVRLDGLVHRLLLAHIRNGCFERAWRLYRRLAAPVSNTLSTEPWARDNAANTALSQRSQPNGLPLAGASSISPAPPPGSLSALLPPTLKTFSILLRACTRWRKGVEAKSLVSDADEYRVDLTRADFEQAISACGSAGDSRNVEWIMKKMTERGMPVSREAQQSLLNAHFIRGESRAGEALLESMTKAAGQASLRTQDYVSAGLFNKAFTAFDAVSVPFRKQEDYVAMLTAVSALKDAPRMVNVLEELERGLREGRAGLTVGPTEIGLACRIFRKAEGQELLEETRQEKGRVGARRRRMGAEEMRCLDVLARLGDRSGIPFLNKTYVEALIETGREEEARKRLDRWLAKRMERRGRHVVSYASQIGALGALGLWPVAHYLYDEMRFLAPHGRWEREIQSFRSLLGVYETEEKRAARCPGAARGKIVDALHGLALATYKEGIRRGHLNHWHPSREKVMDLHRYSLYLAVLAVEVVLMDMASESSHAENKMGPRNSHELAAHALSIPAQDLWVITGRGKHNSSRLINATSSRPNAHGPSYTAGPMHVDETDERQRNMETLSHMRLRDKLARALAMQHGLLTETDLRRLRSDNNCGRLCIRKEAIQTWIKAHNK